MFGTFGRTRPPQKGAPQIGVCWTAARHFLVWFVSEGLYGVLRHLKVHLAQHDIVLPIIQKAVSQTRQ